MNAYRECQSDSLRARCSRAIGRSRCERDRLTSRDTRAESCHANLVGASGGTYNKPVHQSTGEVGEPVTPSSVSRWRSSTTALMIWLPTKINFVAAQQNTIRSCVHTMCRWPANRRAGHIGNELHARIPTLTPLPAVSKNSHQMLGDFHRAAALLLIIALVFSQPSCHQSATVDFAPAAIARRFPPAKKKKTNWLSTFKSEVEPRPRIYRRLGENATGDAADFDSRLQQ